MRPRESSKHRPTVVPLVVLFTACLLVAAPAMAAKKKDAAGVLAGKIVGPQGEVVAGAEIVVTSATVADLRLMAKSDKEGSFSLEIANASGTYQVQFTHEGYSPFSTAIELAAGERQDLRVELIDAAGSQKNAAIDAYNTAAAALDKKDLATAKAKFLEATQLDPSLPQPYLGLADIYLGEAANVEAAAAADRFLTLQPGDPQGLRLAYEAHRRLGNEERAQELLAALGKTENAGGMAVRVYNEGAAAFQAGNDELALERFQSALALDPKLVEAHAALATILYRRESYAEAQAAVDHLLTLDPQNVQGRRVRFLIYDALADDAKAAPALEAYAELDPAGAAGVLYQRADMDFSSGDVAKAQAALERVLQLAPDMPRAHYTLGLCYASSGNTAKAREHLQKFISLAPEDPEAETAREMLASL